jgi:toxin ParE1/3/4
MKRTVYRTSASRSDIVQNAFHLGQQRTGLEDRFLAAVERSFERILASPEIGGLYESRNPRLQGIRVWRVRHFQKYLIFYRPTNAGVEVIRILHGARDIAAVLEER